MSYVKEAFDRVDKNSDVAVSVNEIKSAMRFLGQDDSAGRVFSWIEQRDKNGDEKVSFEVKFINSVRDVYKFEGTCYKGDVKVSEAELSPMITYK